MQWRGRFLMACFTHGLIIHSSYNGSSSDPFFNFLSGDTIWDDGSGSCATISSCWPYCISSLYWYLPWMYLAPLSLAFVDIEAPLQPQCLVLQLLQCLRAYWTFKCFSMMVCISINWMNWKWRSVVKGHPFGYVDSVIHQIVSIYS